MSAFVFLEGDSEEQMFLWFQRNYRPHFKIHYSYGEFRGSQEEEKYLLFPCHGVDNVYPTANKYKFLLEDGHVGKIVRDLEQQACYTGSTARQQLQAVCSEYLNQDGKCVLFAKPNFEILFEADKAVFAQAVDAQLREKGRDTSKLAERIALIDWAKPDLKGLFSEFTMAYRKGPFADKFFSQFDFESSSHPYFVRLNSLFPA